VKLMYDLWYRFGTPPWVLGPRQELVELVESGRIAPCRVIDLGCGTGDNSIYLARHGFDVTGVDFAPSAIAEAKRKAEAAGVEIAFYVDDLTNLETTYGTFDFLVDYGTLDDLSADDRERYIQSVLPLTRPGSLFLLWCHEWHLRWWERVLVTVLPFGGLALSPGEAHARFGDQFDLELHSHTTDSAGWELASSAYLMTRREAPLDPQVMDQQRIVRALD
jgi:SAM-dependent methyltransferase